MNVEDNTQPPFPQQLNQVRAEVSRLPTPDKEARAHSERVVERVQSLIAQDPQRRISFADYMQVALNAPGLGYYSVGNQKFGASGDFVTAPEISDLFAAALSRQCLQYLEQNQSAALLEIGAGSGRLAGDILRFLQQQGCAPRDYFILETSAELQARQAEYLATQAPELVDRVYWLTQFPQQFDGVILANEVLDAMPVHKLRFNGNAFELAYVSIDSNAASADWPGSQLRCRYDEAPLELQQQMLLRCPHATAGYVSELAPIREAWIQELGKSLRRGLVLLVDYGYSRDEYYHAQRNMGTLTCHYRHRVHDDAFFYPGLQDITAFVEFTAIAEAATLADLHVAGYATQAQFLLSCGLDAIVAARMQDIGDHIADPGEQQLAQLRVSQEMKRLILPGEMGERFKVMVLTKDFDAELVGFSQFNMRHKL